jgi:hypothetical protein
LVADRMPARSSPPPLGESPELLQHLGDVQAPTAAAIAPIEREDREHGTRRAPRLLCRV